MNGLSDQQLLRDYAEHRSEAAFAQLVRRHVDLVHSAALRMVRDAHLAEDVTQGVFLALAQNAPQLTGHPVLSAWLHRTARNLAAKAIRTDVRRRARERKAAAMNQLLSAEPEPVWEEVAPHLDAALAKLNEPERDAVLLRYFEGKSAHEMGQILSIGDEAAQKRVSRGVESLRQFLAKRGVAVGASGLVVLISGNAVQSAPVGLALSVSTAALAGGALVPTAIGTSTASGGAAVALTKAILMTKVKISLLGAIVVASVATPLVIQHRSQVRLRQENELLRSQIDQVHQVWADNERLSNQLSQARSPSAQAGDQMSELLRLRGEVGRLRQQNNEIAKLRQENQELRAVVSKPQSQAMPSGNPPGAMIDLGVLELVDGVAASFDLGGGTNCVIMPTGLPDGGVQMQMTLGLTNADGTVSVLSKPRLTARPGQQCSISAGELKIAMAVRLKTQ